jgi:hypothetical protein
MWEKTVYADEIPEFLFATINYSLWKEKNKLHTLNELTRLS